MEKDIFCFKFSSVECKGCGVQQQCGFTMDCGGPCGYIASPGYPQPPGQHSINCRWWIRAPQNQVVELEFLDFDVAESNKGMVSDPLCLQAHVSLFTVLELKESGHNDIRYVVDRFCNGNPPPAAAIVSSESVLEVQFGLTNITSDANSMMRGFLANYHFVTKTQSESSRTENVSKGMYIFP